MKQYSRFSSRLIQIQTASVGALVKCNWLLLLLLILMSADWLQASIKPDYLAVSCQQHTWLWTVRWSTSSHAQQVHEHSRSVVQIGSIEQRIFLLLQRGTSAHGMCSHCTCLILSAFVIHTPLESCHLATLLCNFDFLQFCCVSDIALSNSPVMCIVESQSGVPL